MLESQDVQVDVPVGQSQESLERDAQALRLAAMGYTQRQINEQLGYGGQQNVSRALKRARERILKPAVMEHVATSLARLDYMAYHAMGVLHRTHVVVSGGKVVYDATGETLKDSGPEMDALRTLLRIDAERRKLLGLDAAVKIDMTTDVSPVDASIIKLVEQLSLRGRAAEQAVKRGDRR